MSKQDAIIKLRTVIAEQIKLSEQAKSASIMGMRPILEKKDSSLISGLLAIHDALTGE